MMKICKLHKASYIIAIISCYMLLLLTSTTQGLNNDDLFSFGPSSNDFTFPKRDDDVRGFTGLTVPFVFYNESFTAIYVDSNGILTLGSSNNLDFTIGNEFPSSKIPLIAPFSGDVDNRGSGEIYARSTSTDTSSINRITSLVAAHFENSDFIPTNVIIATWEDVGYYNQKLIKVNTFQCVLASDGTNTYAIFLYLDINWTTGDDQSSVLGLGGLPAQVGFDAGDQINSLAVNGSFTDDIVNIEERSNIAIPGMYMFQINGNIINGQPEKDPPCLSCQDKLFQTACILLSKSSTTTNNIPSYCSDRLN